MKDDDAAAQADDGGAVGAGDVAPAGEPARPSYLNTAALLVGVWVVSFLTAAVLANAAMLAAGGRWLAPSDPVPEGFRLAQFPVIEETQGQDLLPTQGAGSEVGGAETVAASDVPSAAATAAAAASVMLPSPDLLTWDERSTGQLRATAPTRPPADSPSPPVLESEAVERHFIWQVKEDREGIQHLLVSRRIGPVESVSRYTVAPDGQATAVYYGEANHPVLLQYTVIHALWVSLLIVSVLAFWLTRRAPPAPASPAPAEDAAETERPGA